MIFERFEDRGLSQRSYAVGCPETGEVAVVDPRRDVDVYLDFVASRGLEIAHVLETHIHADYASGARELAERTGATLRLSGHDEGERYEIGFPHADLRDGETVRVGGTVRLRALHTPGHTPEHLSFLVYPGEPSRAPADGPAAAGDGGRATDGVPRLMLSGDFLFVGSLGRPDLLGEEAKRELARVMHRSVRRKLAGLPDGLEIYPGHGAGSLCGAGIGGQPSTTLGAERLSNPFLDESLDREEFVRRLLSSVPPFPDYYRRMKELNAEGPPILGGVPRPAPVPPRRFRELSEADHVVIDVRDPLAFGAGHVPGAFGIGAGPGLSTWASWVVPYDRPILLVLPGAEIPRAAVGSDGDDAVAGDPGEDAVQDAIRSLIRVGLDDVRGALEGGIAAWREAGLPLTELPQISPEELRDRLGASRKPVVLDVREDDEWDAGHIAEARHVPGGQLPRRWRELRDHRGGDRPIAVTCGSGYRSTVAASVLERAGFRNLLNVRGGMGSWESAGLPTVT